MNPAFHPKSDCPGPLPDAVDAARAGDLKRAARQRVAALFPLAYEAYGVQHWLTAAPADRLAADLMACIVAADHWHAQLICPQRASTRRAWTAYISGRLMSTLPLLAATLTRWAVLACVPEQWLPTQRIGADLAASLRHRGLHGEVLELRLIPPLLGGAQWVRGDCGPCSDVLRRQTVLGPTAAVLHWPRRTVAAVVVGDGAAYKAFGPGFAADGEAFDPLELAGADVVQAAVPPAPWLLAAARRLGLGALLWRWTRRRRLR